MKQVIAHNFSFSNHSNSSDFFMSPDMNSFHFLFPSLAATGKLFFSNQRQFIIVLTHVNSLPKISWVILATLVTKPIGLKSSTDISKEAFVKSVAFYVEM